MSIRVVAYGRNSDGGYYVQTSCNEEHIGQECDCKSFGENFTEDEAKKLACKKAKELNVEVERW